MAIAVLFNPGGFTREQYDQLNEQMFGSPTPDAAPEGLILHTAGEASGGFRVFDVWESREAFERFMNDQVMPAAEALGMPETDEQPEIYELHNVLHAAPSAA